nr:importin-5 isoform X2 [Ipomoea batatas]
MRFCLIYVVNCALQNRLLAMNYINEGTDDKLYGAHSYLLPLMKCVVLCTAYGRANHSMFNHCTIVMPLLLRSALKNELRFPVSVDSPIITLPKIIIPALVQALEDTTPEERRMTFDIFHCIAEEFKEQGLRSYAKYIPFLFEASKDTVPNIQQQKDTTPEERRMTFDIFHCIAEEFKEQGLRSYAKYIPFLFEASKDTVPDIQQVSV